MVHICPVCGTNYPDQLSKCPICKTPRALASNEVVCPSCGSVMKKPTSLGILPANPKAICRYCRNKFPALAQTHEVICPKCDGIYSKKTSRCPQCNEPNPTQPTPLRESAGKRIKTRLYEFLIYELGGVFCIFGLPFFGLPSLQLLGIVLMALFPFYTSLPSEHDVLASREGEERLGRGWAAGSLVLKTLVKFIMFVLTVIQFLMIPVSKLIPLAISFVYYFTLPVSYKTSQPFKMLEAWFRIGVGIAMAWFFLMAIGYPQGLSLGLMAVAFFATSFPHHKEETEPGVVKVDITVLNKAMKSKGTDILSKGVFSILMLAAFHFSNVGVALPGFSWPPSSMQIIFTAVWLLSLFSGWVAGSERRPATGILMISMTLFVFTFTFTGVIGQAIFGYWWPQVQAFTEAVGEPLGSMWSQVEGGMKDAWLILTNPQQYYLLQMQKQQATQSVVKSGGTSKSIELTKFDLFPGLTGILDPKYDKLVGSIELQNQGEFEANKIILDIGAVYKDPVSLDETPVGEIEKITCSEPKTSNTTGTHSATCNWSDVTIYPNEMKLSTFVFDDSWTDSGINLKDCKNATGDTNCPTCSSIDPGCLAGSIMYTYSGKVVSVNANYTYDYNVNVSIPVDVIDYQKYIDLLEAREITLQELTSQYTGGPVKATIWSQRQPIRDEGEESLFVASIYNEGNGELTKIIKLLVLIPIDTFENVDKIASTFDKRLPGAAPPPDDGCSNPPFTNPDYPGYWVIECTHTFNSLKSGEFKRVSFFVTPRNVPDRKTSLIVGLANYEYKKTTSQSLTIANAPPQ